MEKNHFLSASCLLAAGLLIAGCGGTGSQSASGTADTSRPQLEKIWETDTSLRAPESAQWDAGRNLFFVSDINGDGAAKDGNGFISQMGPDGRIINLHWVDGLDAPKGVTRYGDTLYVADLDSLVVIDIAGARIQTKIHVEGATFLNDAEAGPDGTIYLSDTRQGKIYRYRDGQVSELWGLPEMKGANGLLWWKDKLWILTAGGIYSYDTKAGSKPELFTDAVKNGDGLAAVDDNDLIASRWVGEVYYVHGDGSAVKMLDTKDAHLNTADIAYLPGQQTLIIPTFGGNTVAAYRLTP